jgi:ABC-type transporter Mla MlaB component
MLKIERHLNDEGTVALRLAGEIRGPWVEELRRVAESAAASAAAVRVDLADVSFVDLHGVALLNRLVDRRVILANCSPFVIELLKVRR